MARRRQTPLKYPKTVVGLLTALGVIGLMGWALQQPSIGFVLLLSGAAVLAIPVMRHFRREGARRTLHQKVQTMVGQQMTSLVRRRAQLVWQDAYGKPQLEKWTKEIDYFITQHIEPSLAPNERSVLGREGAITANLIEARVQAAMQDQAVFRTFSDAMTPAEFEILCAEELRRAGWNARVTMQGRDQGVDVVAEKGDIRVVIQCKLYARPVGNKAVQEVAAAKAHEQASYGIVVTNSRYTPAAEQLASTNGIRLLHYSDLRNLHNLLCQ
jgi:restriction system protein